MLNYIYLLCFFLLINVSQVQADIVFDALGAHNKWRIQLNAGHLQGQPRPVPAVPLMQWNEELAEQAQSYADSCARQHAPYEERQGAAENLAWGYSVSAAVDAWAAEHAVYNYPDGFSGSTGHYTQVVWSSSTELGCGWNPDCSMTVCRYRDHGNMNNLPPYQIINSRSAHNFTANFNLSNIYYQGRYYTAVINNLNLSSLQESEYDDSLPVSYIHFILDKYNIYIPKLKVNNKEYFVVLEYQEDGSFTIPVFGETNSG